MHLLRWQRMARNITQHLSHYRICIIALAFAAVLFGLLPRVAMAQDASQQILDAINAARAENGLAPLVTNALLSQAAQGHVDDMINNYVYGHYGSDGSTVHMRVARTGYSSTPWVSENWVSASSPAGAMRWWMGDYIHRVNILTPRWVEVGIGVGIRGSEMIFVTVFSAGGGANSDTAAIAAASEQAQEAAPPPSVRIEQVNVPPEGLDYTVSGGDTLLGIGLRYGLPWERIAEANGMDERTLLQIGQTLRIPGSGVAAAPPAPAVPTEDYVVQPNDTLYSIAASRGMYWDEVASVNGFGDSTILQIGQVIQVPIVEAVVADAPSNASTMLVTTRREVVGPITPEQSPEKFDNYSLKNFDPAGPETQPLVTTAGIGGPISDGTTVEVTQIAMAQSEGSGATSAVLEAHAAAAAEESQEAEVSYAQASTAEVSTAAVAAETMYTVQAGDTIISIAMANGLEWGALLTLNGMDENSLLQPGQIIRLR